MNWNSNIFRQPVSSSLLPFNCTHRLLNAAVTCATLCRLGILCFGTSRTHDRDTAGQLNSTLDFLCLPDLAFTPNPSYALLSLVAEPPWQSSPVTVYAAIV